MFRGHHQLARIITEVSEVLAVIIVLSVVSVLGLSLDINITLLTVQADLPDEPPDLPGPQHDVHHAAAQAVTPGDGEICKNEGEGWI